MGKGSGGGRRLNYARKIESEGAVRALAERIAARCVEAHADVMLGYFAPDEIGTEGGLNGKGPGAHTVWRDRDFAVAALAEIIVEELEKKRENK